MRLPNPEKLARPTQDRPGQRFKPLVYALGRLGYDCGNNVNRDRFVKAMKPNLPEEPQKLLNYLDRDPEAAAALVWTLVIDATPVYAIRPAGPYAAGGYAALKQFLKDQLTEGAERISLPGVLNGHAGLLAGRSVPVIEPAIPGMYNWTTGALADAVADSLDADSVAPHLSQEAKTGLGDFLERIYYEQQNLGLASPDRALNYAATNAFQAGLIAADSAQQKLALESIATEPGTTYNTGPDCWDILLTFINPEKRFEQAKKVYRFTVDAGDVFPAMVGGMQSWYVY